MTSNDFEPPKWGVLVFFFQFLALVQILRVNCNEMDGELKIDQDNLRTVTARLSRVS